MFHQKYSTEELLNETFRETINTAHWLSITLLYTKNWILITLNYIETFPAKMMLHQKDSTE